MFILTLSHMGMAVLLLVGQEIDSKIWAGWIGEKRFAPHLLSWISTCIPSFKSVFLISYSL